MSGYASPPSTPLAPRPTNPLYTVLAGSSACSSASSSSDISCEPAAGSEPFMWTPPTPDAAYWANVARARDIRHRMLLMKNSLAHARRSAASSQLDADVRRLGAEVLALERRLMQLVDRYVLSYDDVVGAGAGGLGALSPPTSPGAAPERPLPPTPAPAPAVAALGSQAFINSYKQSPGCRLPPDEPSAESRAAPRRLPWGGLFGKSNVRPAAPAPYGVHSA
ncbi:hypothetical protein GGI04_002004 [Coemansia thaxteri]|uniref:Uncharacterized protein n=1 Tax=Coemansia thaxteri TaxID=2663907 RepID=A0A9W8BIR3_9FUNG|nr:hypothetical protein H4R26_003048 [Coemansia thaxteri]KAJ2006076.1 hypothetical protein GGI04_002004 [Coemansia thaxteri]KAJ2473028.1 hypothetical protein GGI02_001160 [Coemansia sp. RSA 2322]KAJ2485918.1 hypothetical protein EV174_001422 [Coemansia sp. RSA 2320]